MKIHLAVTDTNWFSFLKKEHPNFWQPAFRFLSGHQNKVLNGQLAPTQPGT